MKQIRIGVFETNSSSTHSVCIAEGTKEDLIELISPDKNGVLKISTGEFGWEREEYKDVYSRLEYAATYALNTDLSYDKKKLSIDVIVFEGSNIDMLVDVLKEYTGAANIEFIKENDIWEFGYIDHQSMDEASKIFESKVLLAQFLFNPNSSFTTDNDN